MIQITILLKHIIIINVIHPLSYLKTANNLNFPSEKYKLVNRTNIKNQQTRCSFKIKNTHYNKVQRHHAESNFKILMSKIDVIQQCQMVGNNIQT